MRISSPVPAICVSPWPRVIGGACPIPPILREPSAPSGGLYGVRLTAVSGGATVSLGSAFSLYVKSICLSGADAGRLLPSPAPCRLTRQTIYSECIRAARGLTKCPGQGHFPAGSLEAGCRRKQSAGNDASVSRSCGNLYENLSMGGCVQKFQRLCSRGIYTHHRLPSHDPMYPAHHGLLNASTGACQSFRALRAW
jgi:hypothetical protein